MIELDRLRLTQALSLATAAIGLSDPNPRVGCVIGLPDGTVLGSGHTQAAGQAHAEVMALRDAQAAGRDVRGATAWVTLEPCAHHGRTPPCCDALVNAGIGRVVVAIEDPFPRVAGEGIRRLRAHGVQVDLADDGLATEARELNVGFFSRIQRGRPWVRVKAAASLDGVTALHNGQSQWITGPQARADGHAWRRRAGAVLTGIGTVLADDPRLDVREVPTVLQPLRTVVDSGLRTPSSARLLQSPGRALVFGAHDDSGQSQRLQDAGADVVLLPHTSRPGVDLESVVRWLAQADVNEVHVEAGATLNAGLVAAGLVDEWLLYLAPTLLGMRGRPIVAMGPLRSLDERRDLTIIEHTAVGDDLRIRARPRR